MRILFDQGTPAPLRRALALHEVSTAFELGWSDLENGDGNPRIAHHELARDSEASGQGGHRRELVATRGLPRTALVIDEASTTLNKTPRITRI